METQGQGGMRNHVSISIALAVTLMTTALLVTGCIGKQSNESKLGLRKITVISEDSTPREVAQVLIDSLESKDQSALIQLVAVEKATADILRITRGRKKFQGMVDKADQTVVSGWRATYLFVKPGSAAVDTETINGEQATVTATAQNHEGGATTLVFELVQEDNYWKVAAGIKQR